MNHSKFFTFLLFPLLISFSAIAQPTLPDIAITSKNGINIINWINPYTSGVKSVTIQRSTDSTFNYTTIGFVKDLNQQNQSFVDARSSLGRNWYRVVLLFTSGTDWISNTAHIEMDSSDIVNRGVLPSNDSIQKLLKENTHQKPESTTNIVQEQEEVVSKITKEVSLPKSKYVYTNPFSGHINIELADFATNEYSLHFFNSFNKEVVTIPLINDAEIVLDKRNFPASGIYQFKLIKNEEEFERGYVTIY